MFKFLTLTVASLILTVATFSQTTIDLRPCEAIKGKTYIFWAEGPWDGPTVTAINSGRISFTDQGGGTSREFFALNTTNQISQLTRRATCGVMPDGKAFLRFSDDNGVYFISYDNGEKIWVESGREARPGKGWMLRYPPPSKVKIFPF